METASEDREISERDLAAVGLVPEYDPSGNAWLVPFPGTPINTKKEHRTNFLLSHRRVFVYDEMMMAR